MLFFSKSWPLIWKKVQELINRVDTVSCVLSPICVIYSNLKTEVPKFIICFKAAIILLLLLNLTLEKVCCHKRTADTEYC